MVNPSYAYAETLDVLQNMDKSYINLIPKKFIEILENRASKTYVKHINGNIDLKEQNLNKETINILALINYRYWVNDEEHRKELLEKYRLNGEKYQKEIREKYNPDNIFKKRDIKVSTEENSTQSKVALMEYKESVFKKIINKIKQLFHIK